MMDKEAKRRNGIQFIDFLSGGNHELFHSNLLAFIAKKYPDYFKSIFDVNDLEYKEEDVHRERENFDISILKDNKFILVIENKMKSLPDNNQLERYNNKLKKKKTGEADNCKKILLTLLEPKDDPTEIGWEMMSYRDLVSRMKQGFIHLSTEPSYLGQFLKDYINYIEDLNKKAEEWKSLLETDESKFKLLRYWDQNTQDKNWLNLFKAKVLFEYKGQDLSNSIGYPQHCRISSGIVRAKPFLEIMIPFKEGKIDLVKKNRGEKYGCIYWIQVYPHEIQEGFTLPYDVKVKLKEKGKDRYSLINEVWKECKKKPFFKEIAMHNFGENFDKKQFIPYINKEPSTKRKKQRAYLYDDAAMVYYIEEIEKDEFINEKFNTIANKVRWVLEKFDKTDYKKIKRK